MEDRLPRAGACVDDDTVIGQPLLRRDFGDELQHALRLVGRKLGDLVETRNVALRQDEQVRVGLRVDVADRDEALGRGDVVAFADERAKEALLRQRGSPPP
jgi:hypothetical protein